MLPLIFGAAVGALSGYGAYKAYRAVRGKDDTSKLRSTLNDQSQVIMTQQSLIDKQLKNQRQQRMNREQSIANSRRRGGAFSQQDTSPASYKTTLGA